MVNQLAEMKTVSKNVRALRKKIGWSQGELAKRAGMSPQAVYLYEHGERLIPLDKLAKMSTALGLPQSYLLLLPETADYEIDVDYLTGRRHAAPESESSPVAPTIKVIASSSGNQSWNGASFTSNTNMEGDPLPDLSEKVLGQSVTCSAPDIDFTQLATATTVPPSSPDDDLCHLRDLYALRSTPKKQI